MCSLQEHIERDIRARASVPVYVTMPPQEGVTTQPRQPEYMTDGVRVWQRVDGQWVDVTPGSDLGLMDSSPDVESHG